MGRPVPVDGTEYRVATPRLSKGLVALGVHDATLRSSAGQFVVVDVRRDGDPPDLLTDTPIRPTVDGSTPPDSDPVPSADTGRWGFPFPVVESDTAAIRWRTPGTTIYWDLPTGMRAALASEPNFRVQSVAVPRRDGDLVLDLLVANDGQRDGMFRAEVSMESFSGSEIIEFPVLAGESRRYTGRAEKILLYFENNGGGTLTVTYPGGDGLTRLERTVEVPGDTTTTATRKPALAGGRPV
jgi:hypothetical protein